MAAVAAPNIAELVFSLFFLNEGFCNGPNTCVYRISREITHHVYGKREGQIKIPRDHEFPAIFHVGRLPFAVFNMIRAVLAFVYNASISLKFFIRSATIISLCLSLVMLYLFF